jgi:hypothetical protein
MNKKVNRFVYWTPRILSIVFALFLVIFSFDVFGEGLGFWEVAFAFFMHNIPSIILITLSIIAWKRELVGAIGFGIFAVLFIILSAVRMMSESDVSPPLSAVIGPLILTVPTVLVAVLYYLNWHKKKQ